MSVSKSVAALLVGVFVTGCGADGSHQAEPEIASSSEALAAEGEVSSKGSFSCDLVLPPEALFANVAPQIDRDRMFMSERPGMRQKHLPMRIDPMTGNLLSGGRYLFDTEQHAKAYLDWIVDDFALNGVPFLERPIFLSTDCHAFAVIGAADFGALHSEQVIVRTERFVAPGKNHEKLLRSRWPALKAEAQARGLTSVWLLHGKNEDLVQLVYFANRIVPPNPAVLATSSTIWPSRWTSPVDVATIRAPSVARHQAALPAARFPMAARLCASAPASSPRQSRPSLSSHCSVPASGPVAPHASPRRARATMASASSPSKARCAARQYQSAARAARRRARSARRAPSRRVARRASSHSPARRWPSARSVVGEHRVRGLAHERVPEHHARRRRRTAASSRALDHLGARRARCSAGPQATPGRASPSRAATPPGQNDLRRRRSPRAARAGPRASSPSRRACTIASTVPGSASPPASPRRRGSAPRGRTRCRRRARPARDERRLLDGVAEARAHEPLARPLA